MSRSYFQEPARRTPVSGTYDVIVVGGGIAGVTAALAAARCGAKTILLERFFALGGLATLGNVTIYLPLCDGEGTQVSAGIAEELLKLSVKDGFEKIPDCWRRKNSPLHERKKHRYRVNFNPATYMLELERRVLADGVDLLYDTRVCETICRGKRIEALIVENKSGRSAITARSFVDATGDADVCHLSGEKTASLASNVLSSWFYHFEKERGLTRVPLSNLYDPHGKAIPANGAFAGDDAHQVTRQVVESRELLYRRMKEIRKDTQAATLINIPTVPNLRMTRRLVGAVELQESDDHKPFDDCVGFVSDWRMPGPVYSIPLRALQGLTHGNLFVAGRAISADSAWDVTRSIPACAVTGQATGVAAALGTKATCSAIRRTLLRQKVILTQPFLCYK